MLKCVIIPLSSIVVPAISEADVVHHKVRVRMVSVLMHSKNDLVSGRIVVRCLICDLGNFGRGHVLGGRKTQDKVPDLRPVSYTHLTLPTKLEV